MERQLERRPRPDRDGTDRAYRAGWLGTWSYDYDAVYPASYDNGCHRSDVAQIHAAAIGTDTAFNLACSGAEDGQRLPGRQWRFVRQR